MDFNPYAMQDRMEAEREADSDAFGAWCEANDVTDPTRDDEERYANEVVDAQERAAEDLADARANGGTGYW